MKTCFRFGSITLALIIGLQLLTCCASDNNSVVETTNNIVVTDEPVTESVAEETQTYEELPELDYGGATISMYVWGDPKSPEYFVEEATGDIVNDAIYDRNRKVEEQLNVTFDFTTRPGTNADRDTFVSGISNSIAAGDSAYEIVAGYSMCLASLTYSQMLVDLTSTDYLYFTNPWWSSGLLKNTSVYGKLYFASGDISTNMLQMMYAVFFNKTLAEDYQIGDLYQLVIDGEWTLDRMLTLAEGIYSDLNGNSQRDRDDQFGLMVYPTYVDGFYFASGLTTTNINSDGIPELSSDYTGEKIHNLLEKLCTFLFDTNDGFIPPYSDSDDFTHGNILFYPDELVEASTGLRDKSFGFGILPMPKYDEDQESYYTLTSFPYSLYGIPIDAVDPNRSSAVLEALAAESYRTVTPALFETAMKVKYSADENDAMMYDILKNTVVFDFGRVFNDSLSSLTYSMFRNSVINNDTNWTSTYAAKKDILESMLEDVISKFEK